MTSREKIVVDYINAYNNFDVQEMSKNLDHAVAFKNISGGNVDTEINGKQAFIQQAEKAKEWFSSRKQTILSYNFYEDQVDVEIDYQGILASDLPNGLKAGSEIKLKGKSIFTFSGDLIVGITDIS